MIYLVTGTPGTGKTAMVVDMILNNVDGLFKMTIEDGTVVDRPLYFCHIDGLDAKKFKAHELSEEEIQSAPLDQIMPQGGVLIVDEADYTYPVRPPSQAVPPYIKTLKELRHHGFTLILMVQHPTMIDRYIRQLVAKHIHLERKVIGTKRYEFFRCEESLNAAAFTSVVGSPYRPPKEAFKYYKSASQHIKFKKKLHPVFIMIPIGIAFMFYLGVPLFSKWFGWSDNQSQVKQKSEQQHAKIEEQDALNIVQPPTLPQQSKFQESAASSVPEFTPEYYEPRITDKPETAPIYDSVRSIKTFEYPVACVSSAKSCNCYSDQGTLIKISRKACQKHIKDGVFNPYKEPRQEEFFRQIDGDPRQNRQTGQVLALSGHDVYSPSLKFSDGPPAQ
ncbi:zonular occludens toxin domain-containing protein [Neisseria sp. WLZKY-1]|uniref:zonular occludens toxin domain-containing protein n=1 Tax=Neisseria sp. WLZKY-1 TaxID=3390377 RepID=UPI00397E23C2